MKSKDRYAMRFLIIKLRRSRKKLHATLKKIRKEGDS